MRRDYSPINDLYGVEPEERRSRRGGGAWLVVVIVLAGLFIYESIRPAVHLRRSPPSDFVVVRTDQGGKQLPGPERLAYSYWDLAVEFVQAKYPFGATLPRNPPADFRLAEETDAGARRLYWNKLRELWDQPKIWVKEYEWDTGWVDNLPGTLRSLLTKYLQG